MGRSRPRSLWDLIVPQMGKTNLVWCLQNNSLSSVRAPRFSEQKWFRRASGTIPVLSLSTQDTFNQPLERRPAGEQLLGSHEAGAIDIAAATTSAATVPSRTALSFRSAGTLQTASLSRICVQSRVPNDPPPGTGAPNSAARSSVASVHARMFAGLTGMRVTCAVAFASRRSAGTTTSLFQDSVQPSCLSFLAFQIQIMDIRVYRTFLHG